MARLVAGLFLYKKRKEIFKKNLLQFPDVLYKLLEDTNEGIKCLMKKPQHSGYGRVQHPIPPLFDNNSRILILGSFPSVKSREAAFFYGHPQNRFWKTLAGILSEELPVTIDEKKNFLHKNHIAVWDVIESCDIIGSSDSSIRNVVPNDLSDILAAADIKQIYCNGARSYEYYCKYTKDQTGMDARKLPSTSPANAAYSLKRLQEEWEIICQPLKAAPKGMGEVLLSWYDYNARILPWRSDPTPYHVWISEIMLQQTRVEAVIPYYNRFMEELPDIKSLAGISEDRLFKLWEGLGYYNRARNLRIAAQTLMKEYGGELPADYQELHKLKGIGDYTAGAIASIAYGLPHVAVDGNVLRIFARLLAEDGELEKTRTKASLSAEALRVMPKQRPGDYNQALMDLGATVCLPNGRPDCESCPLESICLSHRQGKETYYPIKAKKRARRIENRGVFILMIPGRGRDEDRFVVHKRPGKGLLPNLWEFPNLDGNYSLKKAQAQVSSWGLSDYEIENLGEGRHIFTHLEWQMNGYRIKVEEISESLREQESWTLVSRRAMDEEYAIPSAFEIYKKQL